MAVDRALALNQKAAGKLPGGAGNEKGLPVPANLPTLPPRAKTTVS